MRIAPEVSWSSRCTIPDVGPLLPVLAHQVPSRALEHRIAFAGLSRLGENSGRLVHDQDVPVFIKDFKPLGRRRDAWPVRVIVQQALRPDLEPGFEAALAVNVNSAFSNRVLRRAAGQREPLGNQFVQSHAFARVGSQSGVETSRSPLSI